MPRQKMADPPTPEIAPPPPRRRNKWLLFLLLLGLGFLLWRYKNLFVVAMVNNRPITRWQLSRILIQRDGQQTLDSLINQSLVESEVKKLNIQVSDDQVNTKIKEIEATLPQGMTLAQALEYQGTNITDFNRQVRLQIAVNQYFESQVQISDSDIDTYLKDNASLLTATSSADKREEAIKLIKQQKVSELINTWLSDLKTKAKIYKFL